MPLDRLFPFVVGLLIGFALGGLVLGGVIGRLAFRRFLLQQPPGIDPDEVARRVWRRLQAWRDREIMDTLAHPDEAREAVLGRLRAQRFLFGLLVPDDVPAEVNAIVRRVLDLPYPERED